MDDDDDVHSLSAGTGSPEPNGGRITVTLASGNLPTPPPATTTNPPPATQQQQQVSKANGGGGGGGGGGGREDCWSEGATGVLIDAWGERYLELSRGNLKQKHWKEVADIVSSREDYAKSAKTDIQCKNRIDTVKKKYKLEKAKIAAGGGPSQWPFFQQLDELIGPTAKIPTSLPSSNSKVPVGIPVGIRSGGGGGGRGTGSGPSLKRHRDLFVPAKVSGAKGNNQVTKNHQNLKAQFRKRGQAETESSSEEEQEEEEEEEEEEADSDDSFPPEKRPRVVKREVNTGNSKGGKERKGWWGNSVRMLTQAILKFGEAYEQAESAKLQQVVEMEKARMKFAKELELQRMQFFMKTQMEISQLKHGGRNGGSGNATIKHPSGNNNVHNNNNNNNNNNINNSDSDNCD